VQRRLQNCFAIFQVCFYGMAGCGGTPEKPGFLLRKKGARKKLVHPYSKIRIEFARGL
jgi:hypothetical protein